MNHWLAEQLTWLTCFERERELDVRQPQKDVSTLGAKRAFVTQAALNLSDWMISAGEGLRQQCEKTSSVSPWVDNRNFTRLCMPSDWKLFNE
jgi:hypothetical protein